MLLHCLNASIPPVSESIRVESYFNTCAYRMPRIGLQCVIVSFPGHAHFHFVYAELKIFIPFLEALSTLASPISTKLILKDIYVFSLIIWFCLCFSCTKDKNI